jgi:hypothetical protein
VKTDDTRLGFFAEVAGNSLANHRFQFIERIRFRKNGVTECTSFVTALREL